MGRQEIDRKIQEKVEEFDNTRKNHQRAMDSLQASLEAEARSKTEALRIKKKLESDINELEIALDHANKANSEAHKSIKRYQGQLREVEGLHEEESRQRADELRAEQDHSNGQDKAKRALESQINELEMRLAEANEVAAKGGRAAMAKLESRIRELEIELGS